METLTDVAINPDPYLQKGDLVAAALFFEALALTAITIFMAFQVTQVPRRWRNQIVLGLVMMAVATLAAIYRRDYWIDTATNPVEFKFFDWFITVPLMGMQFFMMARAHGAKVGMLIRLQISIFSMLLFGYLGEAVFPEQVVVNGSVATLGLIGIIIVIMIEGYPKVASRSADETVRKGYLALGLSLPLTWLAYPVGYLSVPGNLAEGFMSPESVLIMYSLANILSKGGLVVAVYFISIYSQEAKNQALDRPLREANKPIDQTQRPMPVPNHQSPLPVGSTRPAAPQGSSWS